MSLLRKAINHVYHTEFLTGPRLEGTQIMILPPQPWQSWRNLWADLHIWTGLLLTGVLLIYGLSSIVFNHPGWFPHSDNKVTRQANVTPLGPDKRNAFLHAQKLRKELGLPGNLPKRYPRFLSSGALEFAVFLPGRNIHVQIEPNGAATIVEERLGLAATLTALHGNYGVPDTKLIDAWKYYTNFSIVALLFALPSGLWLWWPHRRATPAGLMLLVGGTIALGATAAAVW